jgi:hypothetical protein
MPLAAFRHRRGTAADLVRLVACWLAAIVLVQGLAATITLVRGPAHRHAEVVLPSLGDAHALAHARGQAHHHDHAADLAVPLDGQALDTAALLLLGALVMLAVVHGLASRLARGPFRAAPAWAALAHVNPPPRKPPRG